MNSTKTSNITLIRITGSVASGKTNIANTLMEGLRGVTMAVGATTTLTALRVLISHCKATPVPVYIIMDDCEITDEELCLLQEKIITISASCS